MPLTYAAHLNAALQWRLQVCGAEPNDVKPVGPRALAFVTRRAVNGVYLDITIALAAAGAAPHERRSAVRLAHNVVTASPDLWLWTTSPARAATSNLSCVSSGSKAVTAAGAPAATRSCGRREASASRDSGATWQVSGPIGIARALLRAMCLGGPRVSLTRWFGVTVACALVTSILVSCPKDKTDVAPVGLAGSQGRSRYVVTMEGPAVDLADFRALQKDQPDAVGAYVERKRTEMAAAQAQLDSAVSGVGGRVVGRWWMSGQATVELAPGGLATVRAARGVKGIEPDRPLQ